MHLVTYAYFLKSNHERVQLKKLVYTKASTPRFKVGVQWRAPLELAHEAASQAKQANARHH